MIKSFKDKVTQDIYNSENTKGARRVPKDIHAVAKRKLDMIHFSAKLIDLQVPPANRLEALKGNLKGYHSIRINDQWRIVFQWTEQGAENVQIIDYH